MNLNLLSTKDRDSCAIRYKGAWRYESCVASNLNGLYYQGKHSTSWEGVNWNKWKGHNFSAKLAEIKIKSVRIEQTCATFEFFLLIPSIDGS